MGNAEPGGGRLLAALLACLLEKPLVGGGEALGLRARAVGRLNHAVLVGRKEDLVRLERSVGEHDRKVGLEGRGDAEGLGELEHEARERKADVALFGHTHITHDEYIDGVRLFNPGSLGFGKSFGVIEVKDGQVISNIARLK